MNGEMREKCNTSLGKKKHSNYSSCLGRKQIPKGNERLRSLKLHCWHCYEKPYSCKLRGWRTLKSGPRVFLGERKRANAPGLIWCLLNLLKDLVLTFVCFNLVLKPSSAASGLLQVMCASEHNSALLLGVLSINSEDYQVTVPLALLWEGSWNLPVQAQKGRGPISNASSAPYGHACTRKVHSYAHAAFPWQREKYYGNLYMVAESRAFQHLVKT